jgi:hypothetical protein
VELMPITYAEAAAALGPDWDKILHMDVPAGATHSLPTSPVKVQRRSYTTQEVMQARAFTSQEILEWKYKAALFDALCSESVDERGEDNA